MLASIPIFNEVSLLAHVVGVLLFASLNVARGSTKFLNFDRTTAPTTRENYDYFQSDYFQNDYFQTGY